MRAACALLIAALLPLPARAQDGAAAVSAPVAIEQTAPASTPAAASMPPATEPGVPASGPAAAPLADIAASAPAAAPAPGRAARKSGPSARKHAAPAQDTFSHAPAAAKRKTQAGAPHGRADDMAPDRNPVIDAINLVATTQRDEIRAADRRVANADWWVDALDREWVVKRPFGPGLFDSTHWFYVSYKVNGRVLMSWFVDLAKGTVSPTTPPDRQEPQK